jgi:hypothetical protein
MTLAKREDGPLVSIAELVRYRPSAFRRGTAKTRDGGRVSGLAANAGIGWDCLMPCVTSFAGLPVLPSMRYSRLRRWSVVYASAYELHARVSDGGGGPSYDR